MSFATVRALALALPGTEEATSYGTPAFRVGGRLFARLHQDGESLVLRAEPEQRETLIETHPRHFFVTDHYRGEPWVLVRLATVPRALLAELIEQAWRQRASARRIRELGETSR